MTDTIAPKPGGVLPFTTADRLALYKLLVEQTNMIGNTRRDASRFFLSFTTAAFGGIGFGSSKPDDFPAYLLVALAFGMILVCLLWFSMVRYYGRIVSAKFHVITQLEQLFEIQPFAIEEKLLYGTPENALRGPILSATRLESWIPLLFSAGYLAMAINIGLRLLH